MNKLEEVAELLRLKDNLEKEVALMEEKYREVLNDQEILNKLLKELKMENQKLREDMKHGVPKKGEGIYMHCLPADISGVSCEKGEATADVFEKHRIATYKEAGFKPYIIAAMMFANKFENPGETLSALLDRAKKRVL